MAKRFLISAIRKYQKYISPGIGHHCKYLPTCSQYMIDAIEKYGCVGGLIRGIWRILRCNPFSKGGYDPVR
ncbi:MAG: membrane protein insertion efficiency factor YidD [Clostridiales bacterium]|nr:membrane protein insertion efficiency factor YidD [Clostridiales bacterium]